MKQTALLTLLIAASLNSAFTFGPIQIPDGPEIRIEMVKEIQVGISLSQLNRQMGRAGVMIGFISSELGNIDRYAWSSENESLVVEFRDNKLVGKSFYKRGGKRYALGSTAKGFDGHSRATSSVESLKTNYRSDGLGGGYVPRTQQ